MGNVCDFAIDNQIKGQLVSEGPLSSGVWQFLLLFVVVGFFLVYSFLSSWLAGNLIDIQVKTSLPSIAEV